MDKEKLLMGVVVDKWDGETIGEGVDEKKTQSNVITKKELDESYNRFITKVSDIPTKINSFDEGGSVNVKTKKIDYKFLLEGCAVEVEEFLNSIREEMLDYRRANLTLNGIGAEGGVMAVTELAKVLNKYYFACLDDDVWVEEMDDQKK